MPNHTTNKLEVYNRDGENIFEYNSKYVPAWIKTLFSSFKFQDLIPMPEEEKDNWHSWNCDNWGTKWDCYLAWGNEAAVNRSQSLNLFKSEGFFHTAWAPPYPVVEKLRELLPEYGVVLKYVDEGLGFAGKVDEVGVDRMFDELPAILQMAKEMGAITDEEHDEVLASEELQEVIAS